MRRPDEATKPSTVGSALNEGLGDDFDEALLTPPPGHPLAIKLGCLCPEIDNGRGKGSGYVDLDGNPQFWINAECPIHVEQDA